MPFRVTGWHTFHITGEQSFWKQHRNCLPTHLTEPQLDHREAAREGTVWALGGVVQGFLPGVLFSPRKAFSNPGERLASTLLHSFLQPRPHGPDGSRLMGSARGHAGPTISPPPPASQVEMSGQKVGGHPDRLCLLPQHTRPALRHRS